MTVNSYLASIQRELDSQANRVRSLIGNKHWLSDGRHKEQILANVLKRHIPKTLLVGQGFVLDPKRIDDCSREQDILILDRRTEMPLFHQSNITIASAATVVALISVKTTLSSTTLKDSLDTLHSAREIICRSGRSLSKVWTGAYFYFSTTRNPNHSDCKKQAKTYFTNLKALDPESIQAAVNEPTPYTLGPDATVSGRDGCLFLEQPQSRVMSDGTMKSQASAYACEECAAALFVVKLLDHISDYLGGETPGLAEAAAIQKCELVATEEISILVS